MINHPHLLVHSYSVVLTRIMSVIAYSVGISARSAATPETWWWYELQDLSLSLSLRTTLGMRLWDEKSTNATVTVSEVESHTVCPKSNEDGEPHQLSTLASQESHLPIEPRPFQTLDDLIAFTQRRGHGASRERARAVLSSVFRFVRWYDVNSSVWSSILFRKSDRLEHTSFSSLHEHATI